MESQELTATMDCPTGMDLMVRLTHILTNGIVSAKTEQTEKTVVMELRDHKGQEVMTAFVDYPALLALLGKPPSSSSSPNNAPPSATTDTP